MEKAWCLGLMVTDGCLWSQIDCLTGKSINKVVQMCNTDYEIVEKFTRFTNSTYKIRTPKLSVKSLKTNKQPFRMAVYNDKLYDDLVKLGLKERKSLDIEWNGDKVPLQFMPDYIRGLWDGDGTIMLRPSIVCKYVSGSTDFISGLDNFLSNELSLGKHKISATIMNDVIRYSIVCLTGNNARALCRYIYHDKMGDAYLTRKYRKWLGYNKGVFDNV